MIDYIINWMKLSDVHIVVGIILFSLGIFSLKVIPGTIIYYLREAKENSQWDFQPTVQEMNIRNLKPRGKVPPP